MFLINGEYYNDLGKVPISVIKSFLNHNYIEEVIRFENSNLIYWEQHYFQLMASMRIFRMEIPPTFTPELLSQMIFKLISKCKINTDFLLVFIKAVKSFEVDKKNIIPESNYMINIEACESLVHNINDYVIDLYKDFRLCKNSFNINNEKNSIFSLGKVFAFENNIDDCIILNSENNVVCSCFGSIFFVYDNIIKTPKETGVAINNVYKKQLIGLIKKNKNLMLLEEDISPFQIQKADEVFIVNLKYGIQNISSYRKKQFSCKKTKNIIRGFFNLNLGFQEN
tara:strand:+ start:1552 stop:2397 length:846 start_codon:yes stop_codon:yes gene_type:complete